MKESAVHKDILLENCERIFNFDVDILSSAIKKLFSVTLFDYDRINTDKKWYLRKESSYFAL